MTQAKLNITGRATSKKATEDAKAVGLSYRDEVVTLKFLGETEWGNSARRVRLSRRLAEDLLRLLNDELEVAEWSY